MRALPLALALFALACSTGQPPAGTPAPEATTAAATAPEAREIQAEAPIAAEARVGEPAPDFTLTDVTGATHRLADLRGKTVVLEWFNPGCPFVVAAYESGPLNTMVKEFQDRGVVWLAINSGAPGKQGHGVETNQQAIASWSMPQPVLLDESGAVGRAYGAKTTPHVYVIDPAGTLVYGGALDNAPRNQVPDSGRIAFARDAIEATLAGEPVRASKTQPWGCSVKYGS